MGLVPRETEPSDKVMAFAGADVLFVVSDWHVIVGECYVHGYMHGEVCQFVDHGLLGSDGQSMQWQDIRIRWSDMPNFWAGFVCVKSPLTYLDTD